MAKTVKKATIRDFKILQDIPSHPKNYAWTYFQTLEEVPWLLRLKNLKNVSKSWKIIPWPRKNCR